jgi:hypothetical protein
MTIDCTSLKPGDKVRLRNGSIDTVAKNDADSILIRLKNEDDWHYPDGRHLCGIESEFDIVEILTNPKPKMDTTTSPLSWGLRRSTLGSTLELDDFAFEDPTKIYINGKPYLPAKDSSLSYPLPYKHTYTVSATTNEVVAITCNGKRFTPADSWPEPITNRQPTKEDADENGLVQELDSDGDWVRYLWDRVSKPDLGWARTSDWKPRPIDKDVITLKPGQVWRTRGGETCTIVFVENPTRTDYRVCSDLYGDHLHRLDGTSILADEDINHEDNLIELLSGPE